MKFCKGLAGGACWRFTALVAAALLVMGTAQAQGNAESAAASLRGIPGVLNPKTGAFTVIPQAAQDASLAAAEVVTYTGTFSMRFNITIKSGGNPTAGIVCDGNVSTFVAGGPYTSYNESKTVKATRTGSTATCLVSIPYAWVLTLGNNQVNMSYVVSLTDGTGLILSRSSIASLATFPMPATGSTTTKTIDVTL
jgi:hypothetical protein